MMKYQRVDMIITSKNYIDANSTIDEFKHIFTIKALNKTIYLTYYKNTSNLEIDKK